MDIIRSSLRHRWDVTIIGISLILISSIHGQSIPFEIRFCVPEANADNCQQMSNSLTGSVSCVIARDKFECMSMIARDQADVLNVDAEDLYLAGRIHNLEPFAMEETDGSLYKYRAGVLVHKNLDINSLSDLKGKRSCHTGVWRTAGWSIPIGHLLANGKMVPDCRGELFTAEQFFDGGSCAPGRWSSDPIVDAQLKRDHRSLCRLCKDPDTCGPGDDYAGYEGSIRCLTDGQGQVAFTTIEAVDKFFKEQRVSQTGQTLTADDYQFLCLDGTKMPVTRRACDWSRRPSNVFLIRKGKVRQKEIYLRFLQQVFYRYKPYRPAWFSRAFVSSPNVTNIVAIAYSQQNWEAYLGNYVPSIEKPMPGCERKNVTFCTRSTIEQSKCLDLQKAAYSRRIRPDIRCVQPGETLQDCIDAINDGRADVISLQPQDLYTAGRYGGLTPVVAEKTNATDTSFFAVAVVRVPSEMQSLSELKGMRSCHTGIGTATGWMAPVGALLEADLIQRDQCNRAEAVSEFFASSCVPGASNISLSLNGTASDVLCRACGGQELSGEHRCELGHAERYQGEGGAFRCLVEGRGDVAFVNHFTPFVFTDGRSTEFWARGLRSDQFRLLCKDGGQGFISDYDRCNLGKVPLSYLAVSETADQDKRNDVVQVLTTIGDTFIRKAMHSFKLFGEYQNGSNVLFSDIAISLEAVEMDNYRQALGQFYGPIEDMDEHYCLNGAGFIGWNIFISFAAIIFALLLA